MTTATWTTPAISHSSDADFRTWGSDFSSYLSTVGLVQTADTGQINWTTVTRPGSNTDAGYEIWYLNDSMHATQGLYLKIWYGTGSSTTRPRVRLQIGEGSDGSGTLTGQTSSEWLCGGVQTAGGGTGTSYFCATTGMIGAVYGVGAISSGYAVAGFIVGRTVDTSGDVTAEGAFLIAHSSTTTAAGAIIGGQTIRFDATAVTYSGAGQSSSDSPNMFLLPGTETNAAGEGGDSQANVGWGPFPVYKPLLPVGVTHINELSVGSTASITFISGDSAHTYISIGTALGRPGGRGSSSDDSSTALLMYWE